MRRDRDRDQQIAGVASPGQPLPLEADGLTVVEPRRDLHLHRLAGRKLHALLGAFGRLRERDGQRRGDVLAGSACAELLLELAAAAGPPAASAAEGFLQDVFEAAKSATGAATCALEAVAPPGEGFEG